MLSTSFSGVYAYALQMPIPLEVGHNLSETPITFVVSAGIGTWIWWWVGLMVVLMVMEIGK